MLYFYNRLTDCTSTRAAQRRRRRRVGEVAECDARAQLFGPSIRRCGTGDLRVRHSLQGEPMTSVASGRGAVALASVALALACSSAASASVRVPLSGWNWGNPTPQGNDLKAIDFLGGRGYAVGSAGTALRTDDGGLTWSGLATGTAGDLTKLQIIDPDTLVVLGSGGCVL